MTGEALGARPYRFKDTPERVAAAIAAEGGEVTPERRAEIELAVRKGHREARNYADATFSAAKSWSVLHAALREPGSPRRRRGGVGGVDGWRRGGDRLPAARTPVTAGPGATAPRSRGGLRAVGSRLRIGSCRPGGITRAGKATRSCTSMWRSSIESSARTASGAASMARPSSEPSLPLVPSPSEQPRSRSPVGSGSASLPGPMARPGRSSESTRRIRDGSRLGAEPSPRAWPASPEPMRPSTARPRVPMCSR